MTCNYNTCSESALNSSPRYELHMGNGPMKYTMPEPMINTGMLYSGSSYFSDGPSLTSREFELLRQPYSHGTYAPGQKASNTSLKMYAPAVHMTTGTERNRSPGNLAYANSMVAGFPDYSLASVQNRTMNVLRRMTAGDLRIVSPQQMIDYASSQQNRTPEVRRGLESQRNTLQGLIEKEMQELMLN